MNNKQIYEEFIKKIYVPIYAKAWYMDAVCGSENWDVWIYYSGKDVVAAMPYYLEKRGNFKYITRPLLTQNNGLLFLYPENSGRIAKAKFEEKVIDEACHFVDEMGLDVFEEQFHWSFTNWLPFYWNGFSAITRYSYVIDDTSNLDNVWEGISSKQRSIIKKGQRNSVLSEEKISINEFYDNYIKIFEKQGMPCPYSIELLNRLFDSCEKHDSGRLLLRRSEDGNIACLSYVIWDEKYLYKIMGGPMPEYSHLDAYAALTWDEICLSHDLSLGFDFEGSVIKRISKSFREYGGELKPYFRIRKVYNEKIAYNELSEKIKYLKK